MSPYQHGPHGLLRDDTTRGPWSARATWSAFVTVLRSGGFMPAYQNVVVECTTARLRPGWWSWQVWRPPRRRQADPGHRVSLEWVRACGAHAQAAAETCAEMGARTVETLAVVGDPATVLTAVARDRGADLLVVGNHGLSTLGERLVRSVPGEVIDKASCDVLIYAHHHRPVAQAGQPPPPPRTVDPPAQVRRWRCMTLRTRCARWRRPGSCGGFGRRAGPRGRYEHAEKMHPPAAES